MANNSLSGTIPSEIKHNTALRFFDISDNLIDGTIMTDFGIMSLNVWNLTNNNLSGTIPSEIGNISPLINFELSRNQLNGTIPSEIGHLVLERIELGMLLV